MKDVKESPYFKILDFPGFRFCGQITDEGYWMNTKPFKIQREKKINKIYYSTSRLGGSSQMPDTVNWDPEPIYNGCGSWTFKAQIFLHRWAAEAVYPIRKA